MKFLQQISTNPYITLSGWLATIIALILCVIFFFLQRKRKEISFSYKTNLLISDKLSDVEGLNITYKENPIEKLSITIIEIINSGNVLIEDRDIYAQQKLRIVSEDSNSKILFAKREYQSCETVACNEVIVENGIIYINFSALEQNEKIIINIYHTGNTDIKFKVLGKIKDGGRIIEGEKVKLREKILKDRIRFLLFGVFIISIVVSLSYDLLQINHGNIVTIISSSEGTVEKMTIEELIEKYEVLSNENKEKEEKIQELQQELTDRKMQEQNSLTTENMIKELSNLKLNDLEAKVKEEEEYYNTFLQEYQSSSTMTVEELDEKLSELENRLSELSKEHESKEEDLIQIRERLEAFTNADNEIYEILLSEYERNTEKLNNIEDEIYQLNNDIYITKTKIAQNEFARNEQI